MHVCVFVCLSGSVCIRMYVRMYACMHVLRGDVTNNVQKGYAETSFSAMLRQKKMSCSLQQCKSREAWCFSRSLRPKPFRQNEAQTSSAEPRIKPYLVLICGWGVYGRGLTSFLIPRQQLYSTDPALNVGPMGIHMAHGMPRFDVGGSGMQL